MLSEELVDIAARHQVYLERLKSGEIKKTDALFVRLDKDLREILLKLRLSDLSLVTAVEGAALVEDIRKKQVEAYTEHLDKLAGMLFDFHEFERKFELDAANEVTLDDVEVVEQAPEDDNGVPVALWSRVQDAVTGGTGKTLAAYLGAWAAHEVGRGSNLVRVAIAEGWSITDLTVAFTGTRRNRYTDGLFGSARRNTATAIRTAIQHVSSATRSNVIARMLFRPKKGLQKGALGYRWVSILDSTTSQICRSLDGRLFRFGKGPLPPAHPNCRSTIVADIYARFLKRADDTRLATGAQGAGKVNAELTYYQWLKTQPPAFQNDALGVTRAMLFRKGGLSATEFARFNLDRNFEPLTLDEMRALAPRIFERAGL